MVKISIELLLKHASHTKRRTNETDNQYLKRLTHVYLQERHIDEIDNLYRCKNLSVIYLYNNDISSIRNLEFAENLTHLYLQKNHITRISGLNRLTNLTKLYLGHNKITVLEGLESNLCLSELYIENQELAPGEKLLFDPRTMDALSNSLNILNVSCNSIDELTDLKVLRRLNYLILKENNINAWKSLSDALFAWQFLYKLDIEGNPLCKHKKYRDKLIIMSKSLVMIDEKEVSESNRQFLQNWYAKKEAKRLLKKQQDIKNESYDFIITTGEETLRYPQSQDMLYPVGSNGVPNQKYMSKNHRQFAEVLAKAKAMQSLPPLEQRPRHDMRHEYFHTQPNEV